MTTTPETQIVDLDEIVAALPNGERALVERILHVAVTYGRLVPPETMHPWIREHFGRVEATLVQKIVKVTNLVTLQGVLFNWLRSSRPIWKAHELDLENELSRGNHDPLDNPLTDTPEDVFGRIEGKYCVTASNIAKFDGFHGLIIYNERHPLRFTRETLHDYIETGARWAERAHEADQAAKYYFLLWNCLWRAGASLVHGHAQVMLGRDMHYAAVEHLRRSALFYRASYRSSYFDDLYRAHKFVGAAFERDGVRVLASLTPIKEHEVILMSPHIDGPLIDATYDVLACLRDKLGVTSFNLVLYAPPLGPTEESWEGFPQMVRIVDRGDPTTRTNDMGAMELYAASVVSSDPLQLAHLLEDTLLAG